MNTVTCPNCNSKNAEGSKFCNRCGNALPPSTHVTCPSCGTRNPRNLLYCDNCGTRLLVTGELSSGPVREEKEPESETRIPRPFSLPTRDPDDELDSGDLLDWLRTGEKHPEEAGPGAGTAEQAAVLDDWLSELSDMESTESDAEEGALDESGAAKSDPTADFADWLIDSEESSSEEGLMDWLSELEEEDGDIGGEGTLADWWSEFEAGDEAAAETMISQMPLQASESEEEPDWLSVVTNDEEAAAGDIFQETSEEEFMGGVGDTLIAPSPFQASEESEPDWLGGIDDFEESEEAETGRSLTDWLRESDTAEETTQSAMPEEEEVSPDWLSDSGADEELPTLVQPSAGAAEEEAFPDWLSDSSAEEAPQSAMAADEEAFPDWLSDSEADEGLPTLIQPSAGAEEEAFPNWLGDLDGEETTSASGPVETERLSDWLDDFTLDDDAGPTAGEATGEKAAFKSWFSNFDSGSGDSDAADTDETINLPGWLDDFEVEDEAPPTLVGSTSEATGEEEDFANWLSDFNSEAEEAESDALADETAEATLPDWLEDFHDDKDATPTLVESFEMPDEEANLAGWLSDFNAETQTADSEAVSAEEAILPDWLEDFEDDEETAVGETASPTFVEDDFEADGADGGSSMPDWLAQIPSHEGDAEGGEETADVFAEFDSAEMPDWMSDMAPVADDTTSETADDSGMPDWLADLPDDIEDLEEDDGDTDWLAALTDEEAWVDVADDEEIISQLDELEEEDPDPTAGHSKELKGVPRELASPGLPDWLQEDMPGPELPADEDEGFFGDEDGELVQGEIPEWLQQMRPSGAEPAAQGLGLGLDDDDLSLVETRDEWQAILENMPPGDAGMSPGAAALSAAEIPAWLQALKPRDFGEEEEEEPEIDEPPETAGPLAGLRGVLPAASAVIEPVAATAPVRYTVSKEQQQQISLLHQLTHEDQAKTKQVSYKKATTFSAPGRLIWGLVLLLLVLAGVLLPPTDLGLPEMALPVPESALTTFNTIESINGRTVLVAFDYTPAMAGELDPIALMLLRQLAENDNRVLTISQSAAGTAIAGQLTGEVDALDNRSLGLLTGEAVGLRTLGNCLNAVGNCSALFGAADTALQSDLADVGLVIILTSDRTSLINWIEQVESEIETPVVTAVTQPLGPLTIPYISSGQVEGSIDGIPAASAYEKRLRGQNGSAFEQFMAQTIVMWVVILALVVTSVFYGLTGFVGRGPKKGSE